LRIINNNTHCNEAHGIDEEGENIADEDIDRQKNLSFI
jgi:hypothetical protein